MLVAYIFEILVVLKVVQHVVKNVECDAKVAEHDVIEQLECLLVEQAEVEEYARVQVAAALPALALGCLELLLEIRELVLEVSHELVGHVIADHDQQPLAWAHAGVQIGEQPVALHFLLVAFVLVVHVEPQYLELDELVLADLLHEEDAVHVVPRSQVDRDQRATVLDHVVQTDHVQVEDHHLPDRVPDEFDDQLEELAVLAEGGDHHLG